MTQITARTRRRIQSCSDTLRPEGICDESPAHRDQVGPALAQNLNRSAYVIEAVDRNHRHPKDTERCRPVARRIDRRGREVQDIHTSVDQRLGQRQALLDAIAGAYGVCRYSNSRSEGSTDRSRARSGTASSIRPFNVAPYASVRVFCAGESTDEQKSVRTVDLHPSQPAAQIRCSSTGAH